MMKAAESWEGSDLAGGRTSNIGVSPLGRITDRRVDAFRVVVIDVRGLLPECKFDKGLFLATAEQGRERTKEGDDEGQQAPHRVGFCLRAGSDGRRNSPCPQVENPSEFNADGY
jgi:hypothetical protein